MVVAEGGEYVGREILVCDRTHKLLPDLFSLRRVLHLFKRPLQETFMEGSINYSHVA